MSVHARWRWGAAAFVLVIFALLSGAHLCGAAQDPGVRPLTKGSLACAEFWLNRYQALIAALIAGVIAFWAGRIVLRQTRATEIQVASQRYDFLSQRIRELKTIERAANEIESILMRSLHPTVTIRFDAKPSWTEGTFMGATEPTIGEFNLRVEEVQRRIYDLNSTIDTFAVETNVIEAALAFGGDVHFFLQCCRIDAVGPVVNFGMGPQPPPPPTRRLSEEAARRYTAAMHSADELRPAIRGEVNLLRVRRDEARQAAL